MKLFKKNINKNTKKSASSTPIRMNIILGVIGVLFLLLIGQLVYLQLIYGARFQAEVNTTDEQVISNNVPRGIMYDSTGKVLVGNTAKNAITYTKSTDVTSEEIYNISNKLSYYLTLDDEKPTERQLFDYYLANDKNNAKIVKQLSHSERYDKSGDALDEATIYENTLKKLNKENLHFTKREKTAALIFNKISGAYTLSTIYIKNNNLTNKELAEIGENLSKLPGVGIGTDWSRNYPNGKSIQSIIGSVSSEKAGLPSDNLQYYLTNGYSRNDRVGTSYLEEKYESLLKGTKSQSKVVKTKSDSVEQTKTIYKGESGSSLSLTLNAKYQQQVEKALQQVYSSAQGAGATQYSNGAYAVAMDPNTGALLAIAGIDHNAKTNKNTDNALGVINQSFVMGSAVKGATVAGGLINKVITPDNTTLPDTPIYLPGTPVKKSVYPIGTFGSLDAQTALEVSSNIYMMQLALKWVKAKYVPHSQISMPEDSFEVLRRNFAMFGLGQKTGVDLPGEVSGITGRSFNNGSLLTGSVLDLAYGNYDAYTPIQMAQYVSTIANGGYRMKPYIVQSIGQTNSSGNQVSTIYNTQPTVQMRIPWTQSELDVIHQGFYRVVHGSNAWGTAHYLKDVKPAIAGKTGTAETFYYDPDNPGNPNAPEIINATFVGYAPASKPKIAVAVVFPGLDPNLEGTYTLQVAKAMFSDYFSLNK